MSSGIHPDHSTEEIAGLITTLHATLARLEAATHGEVDTVADESGRVFLLRRAQEGFQRSTLMQQAAVLDALPAHIALLDAGGSIVSVNETWRAFATANGMSDPSQGVGQNYLAVCDAAAESCEDARLVAAGIRAILQGDTAAFSIEYPCHSRGRQSWFGLTVTPLASRATGAVVMHLEVTSRRKAEEVLQESEERFSGAFEFAPIGVALVSPDGTRWLRANRVLSGLLGYSEEELQTLTVQELTHPDDIAMSTQNVGRAIDGGARTFQLEKRYIHRNGQIIDALLSISLIRDAEGQPLYFVSHILDVTERNRAEAELRLSNQRFVQLAKNINDVFWIRSPDMRRVLYVSPAWERIWGRGLETLHDSPQEWISFVAPEDRARVSAGFESLTGESATIDMEHRIIRPDGEVRWIHVRATQVRDDAGVLINIIGIVTDITERKQNEVALRESRQRLRDIIDGLGPSVFVGLLTPEGILIEINRSPLDATGMKPSDVIGRHFADCPWWNGMPEVQQQVRDAIGRAARGEASRFDVRSRGLAGKFIDTDFSLQPLCDENGRVAFLVPSSIVITERKQAEAALRHSQKMEAVGQLAAGVAHEFNNILQALMSMATITRIRGVSPEIVKIAGEMEVQLRRGARVTQQLLAASRHQELTRTHLDLVDRVATAHELLRRLIPENIRIVVESCAVPASMEGDAGQLQQVLLNLAINARDAMPDGGTLTLRAVCSGEEVALEVEDDGCGFDATAREHIFEPFFTTKDIGKGTGLGLAVVHGIVEQHGGRIEVRSHPGQGTLFRLIFPRIATVPAVPDLIPETALPQASGRILLVEDEEGVREGLTLLLTMAGYEVVAVSGGEEALALPATPVPDLLLSDVSLPGVGGPALATLLRTRWPDLKVTLMTGNLEAATRRTAEEQGWDVLQKPFDIEVLSEHLEHMLGTPV